MYSTKEIWTEVLKTHFEEVLAGVLNVGPKIILAIILIILGWIIGSAVSKAISHLIKTIKLDRLLASAGVEDMVSKSGIQLNSGKLLGELTKWFIIVVFLISALEILDLQSVNLFLSEVVAGYIPLVISSVLILIIGAVLAEFLKKTVIATAKTAELNHANFLGSVTKWSVWIFAIATALYQLGIAAMFIQTMLTGLVFALSLAFGLAFGFGGKDAASEVIANVKKEISSKE